MIKLDPSDRHRIQSDVRRRLQDNFVKKESFPQWLYDVKALDVGDDPILAIGRGSDGKLTLSVSEDVASDEIHELVGLLEDLKLKWLFERHSRMTRQQIDEAKLVRSTKGI